MIFTLIGYLTSGVGGAVFFLILGGIGAGLVAWMFARTQP